MKCPYLEEDEECECVVCRRRKWPARYEAWGLTPERITEMEALEPRERLRVMSPDAEEEISVGKGRHLIARERLVNHGGNGEDGGENAQGSDRGEEGTDVDQELPCKPADTLEQVQQGNRTEESGEPRTRSGEK